MLRAADTVFRTDTGRQRPGNEDSAFADAPLFVVADGMGGAQAGEVASALAVEEFQRGLPADGSAEERLTSQIRSANRRIYDLSRREVAHEGMGTTLTAVFVDDDYLAVAHVGDSRAYIFRDGGLSLLTQDHSLVGELVRQGKLTEAQAAEHPQRSIITRALGIEADVEVDTWSYPGRAGDIVLLCSDGLTSMIDEERIAAILAAQTDLDVAGDELIAAANDAGGRDNITVVLFRLVDTADEALADQPTAVGMTPAVVDGAGETTDGGQVATAPAPAVGGRPAAAKLARTQGRPEAPAPHRRRRSERFIKTVSALLAVVIVLFLVGGGAYLASREYFFIGTNADGIVTIYRGFPYDLPLGVRMYEQFYVSGVPISAVPADRRSQLLNHQLRSQSGAVSLVHAAELGQLHG